MDKPPPNNPTRPTVDSKTRALEAFIQAGVEQLTGGVTGEQDGLLFLSSPQEAMPALALMDPVLEPVDKTVWGNIWIWAKHHGGRSTAFPSYEVLLRRVNVASKATVARSIAILRITRWITLCRRVRDNAGRYRGNVYVLHDEPLSLVDTFYFDPEHMTFLQEAASSHHHARVRAVAEAMLHSLSEQIGAGEDVLDPTHLDRADQRIEALYTVTTGSGGFFGFRDFQLRALREPRQDAPSHRVQKSNLDPVQILNDQKSNPAPPRSSSSSFLNKTTTTELEAAGEEFCNPPATDGVCPSLVYPASLSANEQVLARLHLDPIPAKLRQPVLDELGEKIRVQSKTGNPIRNPIGYLCWMCNRVKAGEVPLTSLSLKARERRAHEAAMVRRDVQTKREITERALGGQDAQTHRPSRQEKRLQAIRQRWKKLSVGD